MADPDLSNYEIKFRSDLDDLDGVDWELCTATFYVRPFTVSGVEVTPLKVEEIIHAKLKDESQKDLLRIELPPPGSGDSYFPNFHIDFNRDKADQLVENSPAFLLTVRAKVDPGLTQNLIFASNPVKEVDGDATVKVEFPPPYIKIDKEITVDSADPDGTSCEIQLRKYNPKKGYVDSNTKLDEELELKIDKDEIEKNLEAAIKDSKFYGKTKRVIIGKDELSAGSVQISRPKGAAPKNQNCIVSVKYKPCTAWLAITLQLEDREEWRYKELELKGEEITLVWPELPEKTNGKVTWQILADKTPRIKDGGFFKLGVESEWLKPTTLPGKSACAGVAIKIIDDTKTKALTQAEPVTLPIPRLELKPNVLIAPADGMSEVLITPHLTFGEEYHGRLEIRDTSYDDLYFKDTGVIPEVAGQQQLQLRCKFHLATDAEMTKLPLAQPNLPDRVASLSFKVYPTGDYAALFPHGLAPWVTPKISLQPSRIEITPEPEKLPRSIDDEKPLFETRLWARVVSADHDKPVPGSCITDEGTAASVEAYVKRSDHAWKLVLEHDPPPHGKSPTLVEINAINVDGYGRIEFAKDEKIDKQLNPKAEKWFWTDDENGPCCVYNHQELWWDDATYELGAQNSDIVVRFKVQNDTQSIRQIKIGKQFPSVKVCFDYPIFILTDEKKGESLAMHIGNIGSELTSGRYKLKYNAGIKMTAREFLNTETNKFPNGCLPEGTVIVVGLEHCGYVKNNAGTMEIWHFLQALNRQTIESESKKFPHKTQKMLDAVKEMWDILIDNLQYDAHVVTFHAVPAPTMTASTPQRFMARQSKWLNRDQVPKQIARHAPVDFTEAHVYVDSLYQFTTRNITTFLNILVGEPPYQFSQEEVTIYYPHL